MATKQCRTCREDFIHVPNKPGYVDECLDCTGVDVPRLVASTSEDESGVVDSLFVRSTQQLRHEESLEIRRRDDSRRKAPTTYHTAREEKFHNFSFLKKQPWKRQEDEDERIPRAA
jgi:hypothetical protein